MLKGILPLLAMVYASIGLGQHAFKAIIKDAETQQILAGATAVVKGTFVNGMADSLGIIELKNIPDGKQIIILVRNN